MRRRLTAILTLLILASSSPTVLARSISSGPESSRKPIVPPPFPIEVQAAEAVEASTPPVKRSRTHQRLVTIGLGAALGLTVGTIATLGGSNGDFFAYDQAKGHVATISALGLVGAGVGVLVADHAAAKADRAIERGREKLQAEPAPPTTAAPGSAR